MNIAQPGKKRRPLTVYLPEDVHQQVEAIAGNTEHSLSRMVSLLVKDALKAMPQPPPKFMEGVKEGTILEEHLQGARVQVPKVKPKETPK